MGSTGNKRYYQLTCNWLVVCACLLFGACSGHGHGLVTGDMETVASTEVAGELALLETPDGVDPAVWDSLKAAFADLAVQRNPAGVPVTEANRIDTLTYVADDGSHLVTWQYRNLGDYNQDGIVGVSDLTPIGVHYGKTSDSQDWAEARLADGNDDGLVGMADITAIGQNYGNRVDGYYLEATADDQAGGWEIIASLAFAGADEVEGQPILRFYADLDAAPIGLSFRATPYANRQGTDTPESGIIGSPVTLVADGRSDWWMEFSDRRHSCFSNHEGPVTNHVWWSLNLDGESSSLPIYDSQGTIIVGGNNGLYFIEPDGSSYWCLGTPGPVNTTPAQAADGTIYFGCDDGNLYAISPDGVIQWTWQSGGPLTASPAIADDGTVWFGTADCRLIALNPDGELIHEVNTESEAMFSPAVSDDGVVYARTDTYYSDYCAFDGALQHEGMLQFWWVSLIELNIYKTIGDTEEMDFQETETWGVLTRESTRIRDTETDPLGESGASLFLVERTYYGARNPISQGPGSSFYSVDNDSYMGRYSLLGNETNQPTREWHSEQKMSTAAVDTTGACFGTTVEGMAALNPDGTVRWNVTGDYLLVPVIGPNHNLIVRTDEGGLVSIGGDMDGTLPEAVAAPEITYMDNTLVNRLCWYPANGAENYEIYREDLAEPIQTVPVTDLSKYGYYTLTDDTVTPGRPYYYKVRAVNSIGPGEFSPSVLGAARIPTPETLTASQGTSADTITLEWVPVELATGYRVYCDAWTEESVPLGEVSAPAANWDHTTRTDWDEHVYYVTAFNEYSESLPVEAIGWLIRGTGDTGPGDWCVPGHDLGQTYRSNLAGPTSSSVAWTYQPDPVRFGTSSHSSMQGPLIGNDGASYLWAHYNEYQLLALNPDGTLRWSCENYPYLKAVMSDGALCLWSSSGMSDTSFLRLLNPDGTERSSLELDTLTGTVIPTGQLITGGDGTIAMADLMGAPVWEYSSGGDYYYRGTPAVAPDGTIYQPFYWKEYVVSKQGGGDATYLNHYGLAAVNSDGTERWFLEEYSGMSVLAVDNDVVYMADGEYVQALDSADGSTIWSYPVSGDLAINHLGQLLVMSYDAMTLLDTDGSFLWEVLPEGESAFNSKLIDSGNRIYTCTYDSSLYLLGYSCYNPNGTLLWSREFENSDYNGAMAINQNGQLITSFRQTVDDERQHLIIAFGE